MNESADGSNSAGEMPIECLVTSLWRWQAQQFVQRLLSLVLCSAPAEPQELPAAGGSSGQRAQVCAVKQQDAMASDISHSSPTGHTYLCINVHWWRWRCKPLGMKTLCPELLQSKSTFYLSNVLTWLVEISLNLPYFRHRVSVHIHHFGLYFQTHPLHYIWGIFSVTVCTPLGQTPFFPRGLIKKNVILKQAH